MSQIIKWTKAICASAGINDGLKLKRWHTVKSLILFSPSCFKLHTLCCIYLHSLACLWSEMSMFQWAGMREGGESLPLAFQYLIFMIWRHRDLNLVMISSLASKCQDFQIWMPVFQPFYVMKLKTSKFKALAFWNPKVFIS